MEVTTEQIRTALQDIAKENNRDHYGLGFVRDVIQAFHSDLPHFMKNRVLERIKEAQFDSHSENGIARLKQLRSVCKSEEEKREMSNSLDIPFKVFCSILKGRIAISPTDWGRMQPLILKRMAQKNEEKQKSMPDPSRMERSAYWG